MNGSGMGWRSAAAGGLVAFALFMSPAGQVEAGQRQASLAEMGPTSAPIGWVQFCRDNPTDCAARPARTEAVTLNRAAWAQLVQVNAHVNAIIEPMTDMEQYGVEERWTYPTTGRGDCEDYVLLKKQLLIRAGLPAGALHVTVVRDRKGDGHAILTVRTDRGDYILDNENNEIRLWHATGYRFVKRQSAEDPNRWVTIGPASDPAAVASR